LVRKFWLLEYDDLEFDTLLTDITNYINDKNDKNDNNYIKIGFIITQIKRNKEHGNTNKSFIELNINQIIFNLKKSIPEEEAFTTNLQKFLNRSFLRGPKINLKFYNNIYNNYRNQTNTFMEFYSHLEADTLETIPSPINVICFSHGSILKDIFKKQLEKHSGFLHNSKLKNTSVIQQENTSVIGQDSIKIQNDTINPIYPINNQNYENLQDEKQQKCFTNNTLNKAIQKIGHFNDNIIPDDAYFKLAEDNTNLSLISQNYNTYGSMFTEINKLNGKDEYEKKYLKYKNKYLNLKKLKNVHP